MHFSHKTFFQKRENKIQKMGSCFMRRNLGIRCLLRPSETRLAVDIGVSSEAPSLTNHQQWRAYARYPRHRFCKIRDSGTSQSVYFSHPFSSFPSSSSSSSSFSSSSKIGFLGWYMGMLESRPLVTKSITASLIYAAADLTAQEITLPPSGYFDSMRTLRMAAYGMLILGPAQHVWFNFMSRVLPRRDLLNILKKIFIGQAIYGPCSNTIFFSYNAALQGETRGEIVARLKRDLLPTMINGLLYWPICDFLTFKFIPVHLQPLINGSFSYVWTIYLTYMANLKKACND